MNYAVNISNQADGDLRSLFEYIAFELQSPENAINQLDRIESAITSLSAYSERHVNYPYEPWRSRGLRVMPVDNYLVFYIPDHLAMTVSIVRVLYGGRDIQRILREEME